MSASFMIVSQPLRGLDGPIELIGDGILQALPIPVFTFMLQVLQQSAKPVLLASVVGGIVLVGGLLGMLVPGVLRVGNARTLPWRIAKLASGIWAPLVIVIIVIASYGTAVPIPTGRLIRLALFLGVDMLVFAAAIHATAPHVAQLLTKPSTRVDDDSPALDSGRRQLLKAAGGGLIVAANLLYIGAYIRSATGATSARRRGVIPDPVTPVGEFYVISKNFSDPRVDADNWTLEITGLIDRPTSLSYVDLLQLPGQMQLTTLTCISNQVGGDLISNGAWEGVALADLLIAAGMRSGAIKIAIYAHDGYTESLPLSKALDRSTMLVHSMNGAPLNTRHGFPARLIVPGKYGIKNVKWIRRIEVVAGDFRGFWQQRGWTDDATIQTMSRIDAPASRSIVNRGAVEVGGVAYAGDRGIELVEWSSDGGHTWSDADSIEQIAPFSWVIWRSTWNPTERGSHKLVVRATDGTGEVQPTTRRPPIPDGVHGLHHIDVGVA